MTRDCDESVRHEHVLRDLLRHFQLVGSGQTSELSNSEWIEAISEALGEGTPEERSTTVEFPFWKLVNFSKNYGHSHESLHDLIQEKAAERIAGDDDELHDQLLESDMKYDVTAFDVATQVVTIEVTFHE